MCEDYNFIFIGFEGEIVFEGFFIFKVIFDEVFGYYIDFFFYSFVSIEDLVWRVMVGIVRGMWVSRKEVSEDGKIVEFEVGDDLIMVLFMSIGVRILNFFMFVKLC